jgi:hypothetical protein
LFNPAAPLTSAVHIDLNLISMSAMAYNNLAFAEKSSLLTLMGNASNNPSASFNTPSSIRGFSSVMIQGPSILVREDNFSYGLTMQFRSAMSLVTELFTDDLNFNFVPRDSVYAFPRAKGAGLEWMELGLHAGKSGTYRGMSISVGANIKYLAGMNGMSAVTDQPVHFSKNSHGKSVDYSDVEMNYGYTSGLTNDMQQNISTFQVKGSGGSLDAGLMISDGEDAESYTWKAGLSVIDAGLISFFGNAQRYELITDTTITVSKEELKEITTGDDFTQLAEEKVQGNGSLTSVPGALVIWLPAAMSFQGEIKLRDRLYLHTALIQRVLFSKQQVLRPNSLSLTPRYESKLLTAGAVLNWYDYHRLIFGGYVRFGPVIIGTDNFAGLFVPAKFEGADFYVGVHLHPARNNARGYQKNGKLNCPKF